MTRFKPGDTVAIDDGEREYVRTILSIEDGDSGLIYRYTLWGCLNFRYDRVDFVDQFAHLIMEASDG